MGVLLSTSNYAVLRSHFHFHFALVLLLQHDVEVQSSDCQAGTDVISCLVLFPVTFAAWQSHALHVSFANYRVP